MSLGTEGGRPLRDRADAGRRLAERLVHLKGQDPVVLALPRGGVVVGVEIARRLRVPLGVLIVRKIGAPDNPEYGLGAIAEDGTRVLDDSRIREAGYSRSDLDPIVRRELDEVRRRAAAYRQGTPAPAVGGRLVILVDDGIATGVTLRCAVASVRAQGAERVVVALGVAPPEAIDDLRRSVDEIVVCATPEPFFAVGEWFAVFDQVDDEEVESLLRRSRQFATASST